MSFIQAKSRDVQLKKLGIPRLELSATRTRLSQRVTKNIDPDIECYFWTDSSTVFRGLNEKHNGNHPFGIVYKTLED